MSNPDLVGSGPESGRDPGRDPGPSPFPAPQAVEFVPVEDAEALVRRIQDDLALLRGEVADAEAAARVAEESASLFDRGLIERATGAHESAIRALRNRWEAGPDERVIDLRTGLPSAPIRPEPADAAWSAGPESQLRPELPLATGRERRPEPEPRSESESAPVAAAHSAPAEPSAPPTVAPPPPPPPAPVAAPPSAGVVVPNETLSLVVSMLRTTALIVIMIVVIVFALAFTAR